MNFNKLRIIQVIQGMGKGGAERYAADLCVALQAAGHEVLLVNLGTENAYTAITKQLNYVECDSYVQPSISGPHKIDTIGFDSIVNEFKPDVIHSHLFKAEMTARQNPVKNCVYVTSCQNNMPEFNNFSIGKSISKLTLTRQYEKKWMIKKYRQCNNGFIAISKDTEAYYKKVLPSDLAKNIRLHYHAIDFKKFNSSNRERKPSKENLVLVYVARYAPYKNHQFLIDVVQTLKREGYNPTLYLLGDGAEKKNVEEKIARLGVEKNVKVMGNVDNVEDYLEVADIYCHPATYEPFGLVIIEAMASGLPAVCLDGKGNRDLIREGSNGFMLFNDDPEEFAEKIMQLTDDGNLYNDISRNAVEFASAFDINEHASQLLEIYKDFSNV